MFYHRPIGNERLGCGDEFRMVGAGCLAHSVEVDDGGGREEHGNVLDVCSRGSRR